MQGMAELLVALVGSAVCGTELPSLTAMPSEQELLTLYRLAKAQDLAHLLFSPLNRLGALATEGELRGKTEKQMLAAVYRSERLAYELAALSDVLSAARIPHIPLKGAVVRELYPQAWMRTSSDIDVLVRCEDAERAAEALVSALGYRNDGTTEHDVQLVTVSGLHVELHFETIEEFNLAPAHRVLCRIWEHAAPTVEGGYRYALDGAMLYFYHVAHMAKHLRYAGTGIRFFLDLWLIKRSVAIDGEALSRLLAEGKLTIFAEVSEQLAEAWFSRGERSKTVERLERHVLSGGVYGSRSHLIAVQNARHGRLGSALRLIFPSYRAMCTRYPSLARHKLALPFYHLHRWLSLLFRGRVRSSVYILRESARVGADLGEDTRLLLQELHLDGDH